MKKFLLIFLYLFLILQISAICSDTQIDINSASIEELDKIIWVGPPTAEKIINTRPFNSVGDLTKVSGIGEVKIADIKLQGLACVSEETEIKEKEEEKEEPVENLKTEIENDFENLEIVEQKTKTKNIVSEVIKLNPQTIKGENDKETSDKSNYALYGFVTFCIFLGLLFILKKNKTNKNEFE